MSIRIFNVQWWKWTGLVLVFFSLIVGLATPLSPGIRWVEPATPVIGDTLVLKVHSANAHFLSKPTHLQAALSDQNGSSVKAYLIHAEGDNLVEAHFVLPLEFYPGPDRVHLLDLEVASDYDGLVVQRQSVQLKPRRVIPISPARSLSRGPSGNLSSSPSGNLSSSLSGNLSSSPSGNLSSSLSSSPSVSPLLSPSTNSGQARANEKSSLQSLRVLPSGGLHIQQLGPAWFSFPYREILYESIRNLFFHVAMWPAMLFLFLWSVIFSVAYLKTGKQVYDFWAVESTQVGLLFAVIGIVTGSLWAKYTWGDWWPNDPKLNGTAIAILLYFAYIVLRNSITEDQQRAKISAVYNVFAFPLMFVVIMILPRLTDSLHPGNGGNPGFNTYDLDSHLRLALYPAFLGWILVALWITEIRFRIRVLENPTE